MSFCLRAWLFAITFLLVAEDFQSVLKIEADSVSVEHRESEQGETCEECEEENGESEKKEEQKEEKKEKDENKNDDPDALSDTCSRLLKNKFRDALHPLSIVANELESPPPEV